MKIVAITLALLTFFPALVLGGEKEESFLNDKMLPLAQEFVKRNKLPTADFGTNNIRNYDVNFFTDGRLGCTAHLRLKNGYGFDFDSDGTNAVVWVFKDGKTRTYFELNDAPKEKVEAIKALNVRNKLSKTTALELAKKYFKLQGHKEENFHAAEIYQSYWSGKSDSETLNSRRLPYYEIEWYRKDVKQKDRDEGLAKLPFVRIEVSGIDSHLISYSKLFMPIGSDF